MERTINNAHKYVFIMAGGVGSRFWPKSRQAFPKQFLDILGVGRSLLQLTYDRFLKVCPPENIFVVTSVEYQDLIRTQLPAVLPQNILAEPCRNNTAPGIAYAAFRLASQDPDACMVIAPSDHFILREDIFVQNISQSLDIVAKQDMLLTLGITPTRPDTGYGYIKYDKADTQETYKVVRFTEKPVYEKAVEFLEDGSYVWNAGIFIWNVKAILKAFETFAPAIHQLFQEGMPYYNTPEETNFISTHYAQSPNISIDYAIMEKAENVYTMPVDFGWSDLGTWASLFQVGEKAEPHNNVVSGGTHKLEDTSDCIIHIPKDKLAVVRGLKDYIIVDDSDVLLIYPKSYEQEIKKITEHLKTGPDGRYL